MCDACCIMQIKNMIILCQNVLVKNLIYLLCADASWALELPKSLVHSQCLRYQHAWSILSARDTKESEVSWVLLDIPSSLVPLDVTDTKELGAFWAVNMPKI